LARDDSSGPLKLTSNFGFVFLHCKLTGDATAWNPATTNPATTAPTKAPGKLAYLGRPWRPYAAVAFIDCELDDHIRPQGWNNWRQASNEQTARYCEYNSTGPGANPSARVAWSKQLTKSEADAYTIQNILGGSDNWDPTRP
jgi:pectinesterase